MTTLQPFDLLILLTGGLTVLYQLWLVLAAEQGRTRDRISRVFPAHVESKTAVCIAVESTAQLDDLAQLLETLANQSMPNTAVQVHLACWAAASHDQSTLFHRLNQVVSESTLQPHQVRTWQARQLGEQLTTQHDHLLGWLSERVLATGWSDALLFLRCEDQLPLHYIETLSGYWVRSRVIQPPLYQQKTASLLSQLASCRQRLASRIAVAGRFHARWPVPLLDSGFAIQSSLLEAAPRSILLGHGRLSGTLAQRLSFWLAQQEVSVQWLSKTQCIRTPQANRWRLASWEQAYTALDTLSVSLQEGYRILGGQFELFIGTLLPPLWLLGWGLVAVAGLIQPSWLYGGLGLSILFIQALAVIVARGTAREVWLTCIVQPIVSLLQIILLPIAALTRVFSSAQAVKSTPIRTTASKESADVNLQTSLIEREANELQQVAALDSLFEGKDVTKLDPVGNLNNEEVTGTPLNQDPLPLPQAKAHSIPVELIHGDKTLPAMIEATQTTEGFHCELQYKHFRLSTGLCGSLEAAYHELNTQLEPYQLTLRGTGRFDGLEAVNTTESTLQQSTDEPTQRAKVY